MLTKNAFRVVFLSPLFCFAMGCASSGNNPSADAKSVAAPGQVPEELSLKEDRQKLDALRSGVPADVRRENDEVALILRDMSHLEEEPNKVAERFNKAVREKREKIDKQLRTEREEFAKAEKKTRDDFLSNLQSERERFTRRTGVDRQQRSRYFADEELKRKEFFAGQADKRREFEADVNSRRKDFEDYVREKSNRFRQEHQAYRNAYYERKKGEQLKKRMEEKEKRLKAEADRKAAKNKPSAGVTSGPTDQDQALMEEMSQPNKTKITPLQPEERQTQQ